MLVDTMPVHTFHLDVSGHDASTHISLDVSGHNASAHISFKDQWCHFTDNVRSAWDDTVY